MWIRKKAFGAGDGVPLLQQLRLSDRQLGSGFSAVGADIVRASTRGAQSSTLNPEPCPLAPSCARWPDGPPKSTGSETTGGAMTTPAAQ